jgi:carbon-monoxide dehydrogenase small subunit
MTLGENRSKEKKHIALRVNGEKVEADVESRITLAEFLREQLRLTGTKVGCNRAECGSCTIILGLENNTKLHPLQEAFIEHDALQCGYCTPGMLMALKALLDKNPHPAEGEIKDAIDGNFCRCGSYSNHLGCLQGIAQREQVKSWRQINCWLKALRLPC